MAINDPYDRSGQYADGDRGAKLDNYSDLAPDRRDVAIGTMMGEGGWDNKEGYAGILDTIENRISGIEAYGGLGPMGNFGTRSHTHMGDHTLEGVVKAPDQFSTWSPSQRSAYGTATRGEQGKPRAAEQGWYDQAQQVYDDYYDDGFGRGIAQGGTFYQNDAAVSKRAGAFQERMQRDYGAVPIGIAGHVVTGPGLHKGITGQYGEDLGDFTFADELGYTPEVDMGYRGVSPGVIGYGGFYNAPQGWNGTPQRLSQALGAPLLGQYGEDFSTMATPWSDELAPSATMRASFAQPISYEEAPPAAMAYAPTMAAYTAPRQAGYDPADFGGSQAFGPNDPFGGIGYGSDPGGYANVVDSYDPSGSGPSWSDSGYQDSPQAADAAAGAAYDAGAWGDAGYSDGGWGDDGGGGWGDGYGDSYGGDYGGDYGGGYGDAGYGDGGYGGDDDGGDAGGGGWY